jgi:serine/threonine-protein kinase RsbW
VRSDADVVSGVIAVSEYGYDVALRGKEMSGPQTVRVALAGRPENVALIRAVLSGVADTVDFGDGLDDIKAAVSEACNNVVVHAYGGDEGPLEVDIRLLPGQLEVVVRDHGSGVSPRVSDHADDFNPTPGRGLGLPVMRALADSVVISEHEPHGTEVALRFGLPALDGVPARDGGVDEMPGFEALSSRSSEVRISISPAALGSAVLSRVVSASAARANFSVDRLSDAQLVVDALTANVEAVLTGPGVAVGIGVRPRTLEFEVGPLKPGGSRGAVAGSAVGGSIGPLIERLTDEVDVVHAKSGEVLKLVMVDSRPAAGSV